MANEQLKIEIWKQVIAVQMHFNEIEMKVRSIAVTVLGALLGAAGYAQSAKITLTLFDKEIYLSLVLVLSGLLTWFAFYFMDRHWYHRLLLGAVKQGQKIEESLGKNYPEITLTKAIGQESPFKLFWLISVHSTGKFRIFYGGVMVALLVFSWALLKAPLPDKEQELFKKTDDEVSETLPTTNDSQ